MSCLSTVLVGCFHSFQAFSPFFSLPTAQLHFKMPILLGLYKNEVGNFNLLSFSYCEPMRCLPFPAKPHERVLFSKHTVHYPPGPTGPWFLSIPVRFTYSHQGQQVLNQIGMLKILLLNQCPVRIIRNIRI